jgi:hypothetical protein
VSIRTARGIEPPEHESHVTPITTTRQMIRYSPFPVMALTARSLHCSGSVRLQSYFHRPDEPAGMPVHDPIPTLVRQRNGRKTMRTAGDSNRFR